jgi:hypothetical protein
MRLVLLQTLKRLPLCTHACEFFRTPEWAYLSNVRPINVITCLSKGNVFVIESTRLIEIFIFNQVSCSLISSLHEAAPIHRLPVRK